MTEILYTFRTSVTNFTINERVGPELCAMSGGNSFRYLMLKVPPKVGKFFDYHAIPTLARDRNHSMLQDEHRVTKTIESIATRNCLVIRSQDRFPTRKRAYQ